jgi:hypothetical protein
MGTDADPNRSLRRGAALAVAAVAWVAMAVVVLRNDSGQCGGSLGGVLLTPGVLLVAAGTFLGLACA